MGTRSGTSRLLIQDELELSYPRLSGGRQVEPLSIINPPVSDLLNDPQVTSMALLKMIDEQEAAITKGVRELSEKVQPSQITPFDTMVFALSQHHMHVTSLVAKLTARNMDLAYGNHQLALRMDRLTKWLIGLTIALGLLALTTRG